MSYRYLLDPVLRLLEEQSRALDGARPQRVSGPVRVLCALAGLDARDVPTAAERRRGAWWGVTLAAGLAFTFALVMFIAALAGLGRSGFAGWAMAALLGLGLCGASWWTQRTLLVRGNDEIERAAYDRVVRWRADGTEHEGQLRMRVHQALFPPQAPHPRLPVAAVVSLLSATLLLLTVITAVVFVPPSKPIAVTARDALPELRRERLQLVHAEQRAAAAKSIDAGRLERSISRAERRIAAATQLGLCGPDAPECQADVALVAGKKVQLEATQAREVVPAPKRRTDLQGQIRRLEQLPEEAVSQRSFGERLSDLPGELRRKPLALAATILLVLAVLGAEIAFLTTWRVRPHEYVLRRTLRRRLRTLRDARTHYVETTASVGELGSGVRVTQHLGTGGR